MCFAAGLRACRLHAHLAGVHQHRPSRIGQPSAYRSTLARFPRGCTPQTSLCLATYGILEESRVASRRSLLVFRRGVRGAASTNARPGFQHVVAVCAINRAGLLGSITFRSLDNGAMVQEARKHIRDVNNIAGVVIGSRLRSNNAGPSVSVSCCLAETAESWGWSSLTSIQ